MSFDSARDRRTADAVHDDRLLMCKAIGCPNIWTNGNSLLCHWHEGRKAHDWPRITGEIHDAITEQSRQRAMEKHRADNAQPLTMADKTAILQRLRPLLQGNAAPFTTPGQCYARLDAWEREGRRLTPAQRAMLAAGLHRERLQERAAE